MSCHNDSSDLSQPLVRPHFFAGQLLTAADLDLDQEYLSRKRSIHDRWLHGWGVVCGLEVESSGDDTIVVSPGVAVDGHGREIVVPAAAPLRIERPESGFEDLDVVLRFADRAEDAHTPEGEPTRIADGYALDARPQGTASRDEIVLARVRRSADAVLQVTGEDGRREAPSVERLWEMIEELRTRISALESRAHTHHLWSWLRRIARRYGE